MPGAPFRLVLLTLFASFTAAAQQPARKIDIMDLQRGHIMPPTSSPSPRPTS